MESKEGATTPPNTAALLDEGAEGGIPIAEDVTPGHDALDEAEENGQSDWQTPFRDNQDPFPEVSDEEEEIVVPRPAEELGNQARSVPVMMGESPPSTDSGNEDWANSRTGDEAESLSDSDEEVDHVQEWRDFAQRDENKHTKCVKLANAMKKALQDEVDSQLARTARANSDRINTRVSMLQLKEKVSDQKGDSFVLKEDSDAKIRKLTSRNNELQDQCDDFERLKSNWHADYNELRDEFENRSDKPGSLQRKYAEHLEELTTELKDLRMSRRLLETRVLKAERQLAKEQKEREDRDFKAEKDLYEYQNQIGSLTESHDVKSKDQELKIKTLNLSLDAYKEMNTRQAESENKLRVAIQDKVTDEKVKVDLVAKDLEIMQLRAKRTQLEENLAKMQHKLQAAELIEARHEEAVRELEALKARKITQEGVILELQQAIKDYKVKLERAVEEKALAVQHLSSELKDLEETEKFTTKGLQNKIEALEAENRESTDRFNLERAERLGLSDSNGKLEERLSVSKAEVASLASEIEVLSRKITLEYGKELAELRLELAETKKELTKCKINHATYLATIKGLKLKIGPLEQIKAANKANLEAKLKLQVQLGNMTITNNANLAAIKELEDEVETFKKRPEYQKGEEAGAGRIKQHAANISMAREEQQLLDEKIALAKQNRAKKNKLRSLETLPRTPAGTSQRSETPSRLSLSGEQQQPMYQAATELDNPKTPSTPSTLSPSKTRLPVHRLTSRWQDKSIRLAVLRTRNALNQMGIDRAHYGFQPEDSDAARRAAEDVSKATKRLPRYNYEQRAFRNECARYGHYIQGVIHYYADESYDALYYFREALKYTMTDSAHSDTIQQWLVRCRADPPPKDAAYYREGPRPPQKVEIDGTDNADEAGSGLGIGKVFSWFSGLTTSDHKFDSQKGAQIQSGRETERVDFVQGGGGKTISFLPRFRESEPSPPINHSAFRERPGDVEIKDDESPIRFVCFHRTNGELVHDRHSLPKSFEVVNLPAGPTIGSYAAVIRARLEGNEADAMRTGLDREDLMFVVDRKRHTSAERTPTTEHKQFRTADTYRRTGEMDEEEEGQEGQEEQEEQEEEQEEELRPRRRRRSTKSRLAEQERLKSEVVRELTTEARVRMLLD